jgi:hypothetical protein
VSRLLYLRSVPEPEGTIRFFNIHQTKVNFGFWWLCCGLLYDRLERGLLLDKIKPEIVHSAAAPKSLHRPIHDDFCGSAAVQINRLASSPCIYAGVIK